MKLIHSTGRELRCYDLGPMVYRIYARDDAPIKRNGWEILDDDAARAIIRELRMLGYEGERCD